MPELRSGPKGAQAAQCNDGRRVAQLPLKGLYNNYSYLHSTVYINSTLKYDSMTDVFIPSFPLKINFLTPKIYSAHKTFCTAVFHRASRLSHPLIQADTPRAKKR